MTDLWLDQILDERRRLPDGMFERTCKPRWENKLEDPESVLEILTAEERDLLRRALSWPMRK